MAKGFKKQLQGGGFQNLTISGAAELQNMRLQSDIEINALKEQRARQSNVEVNLSLLIYGEVLKMKKLTEIQYRS